MAAPHLDYESIRADAQRPRAYPGVRTVRWMMAGFWALLTFLTMFGLFAGALAGFIAPETERPAFAIAITAAFFIAGLLAYLVFWTVVHEQRDELN